jgi:hypothetical protein
MPTQSKTLKHGYKHYKVHVEQPVSQELYENICREFNIKLFDLILDGYEFDMGSNMGTLSVKRIDRSPSTLTVDWNETK